MNTLIHSGVPSKRWLGLVLAIAAFLPGLCLSAQTTATNSNKPIERTATMKTFVIIFRQGPPALTDADRLRRAEETGVWARHQNEAGHKLDPRILAPEGEHRGPEEPTAGKWPVTAILFLEARDLEDAAQVAESHPGLRYGANVEIRPWTPPVPITPPAQP